MTVRMPLLVAASLAALALSTGAVQTETWSVATRAELAEGELRNLVLNAEGTVDLGYAHGKVKTDETSLWCGLAEADDTLLFGTGSGKVLRLAGDKAETLFDTGEMLVTALVRAQSGELFLATLPNGKIFRIDASGKGNLFCTLPAKHVWALEVDAAGGLFAATGPGGKVYQVDATGGFRIALDTRRENALSLARTPDGSLLVGTAGAGVIYAVAADGKVSVLADFGDAEVKDLKADAGGVWAAVNSGVKAPPAEFLQALSDAAQKAASPEEAARKVDEAQAPENAAPAQPGPVVQSTLYRIPRGGAPREMHSFAHAYLTALLPEADGSILVATNNSGRVFRIAADRRFSIPLDLPETQVLALLARDGVFAGAATGTPGAAYRISRAPAADGTYLSRVFDAKGHATWGNLTWTGRGRLVLATRTGNTSEPDETWSDWTPADGSNTVPVASPSARYLQFRATWSEPEAQLTAVHVAFVPENQRPVVTEVLVLEVPDPAALEGGQPPALPPGKPFPPEIKRTTQRKIKWQARDPNEDLLTFWVYYRREGTDRWVPLNPQEPLRVVEANWGVDDLPDGWYGLRVVATDELANPTDRALSGEATSARFLIDHGRPEVVDLAVAAGGRVTGKARDAHSAIGRIDWRWAGTTAWTRVSCADGVFDESEEEFAFDLPSIPAGGGTLHLRVTDQAGNTIVSSLEAGGA